MKQRMTFLGGLLAVALLVFPGLARAQQVEASLSQDTTAVGQPVRLDVVVTGGGGSEVPRQLNVDGLDGRFVSKSVQAEMRWDNGRFSNVSKAVFSYVVVPLRTGDFTIPPISVSAGGKTYKTQPLQLRVMAGQGGVPVRPAIPVPPGPQGMPPAQTAPPVQSIPQPGAQAQAQATEEKITFGDLIVPKRTVYVGEVVPIELRFYYDARFPVRLPNHPGFSGDGFTVMNFSKPGERQQEIDGRLYNVVIFQTALTAAKAGTLEVPAATMESQIQVPSRHQPDSFFGGLLGQFGMDAQMVTVSTNPVKLEVKKLPKDGRPDDFSGAIGQFSMQADTSTKKAGPGDPITLTVTVSGRGNFDAMGAPTLTEAEAWRTYPPGEKFTASASDPIGFNGEKAFDFTLVARQDTQKTPAAIFSYFDPAVEKYVTLKTVPIVVDAKGGGAPTPTPAMVAAATPAATPSAATPAKPDTSDLLAKRFSPGSFVPFVHGKTFMVVNAALAGTWTLALLVGLVRVASSSSMAKKSAARREHQKMLHQLEDPAIDAEQFHVLTAAFIRARLGAGSHVDLRDAVEAAALQPETKSALLNMLNLQDELKYSTGGPVRLGADERQQMLTQIKAFNAEMR